MNYKTNAPNNVDERNDNDRLAVATDFANELSNYRLRKRKQVLNFYWTAENRARQSARIHERLPWLKSTGPKTRIGKARSARNNIHRLSPEGWWLRILRDFHDFAYRSARLRIYTKTSTPDASVLSRRRMTLEQLIRKMRMDLENAGIATAALDARLLARQGGQFSDADLISKAQTPLTTEVIDSTLESLQRRLAGEPVSRIAGEREFWGLTFKIAPATLDPRPDTETLVAATVTRAHELSRTRSEQGLPHTLRILDLGTGSGCIAISLLKELPDITVVATDIQTDALTVSRENALIHGVSNRLDLHEGSWFAPIADGEVFDLIVSNPPYIPRDDITNLAPEVRLYDPILALDGGDSGLLAYEIILRDLKKHLACDGSALFEIGRGQEKELARLIEASSMNQGESYSDLAGTLRVIEIIHGKKRPSG